MSTIKQDHDQLKLLAIFATVVEQNSFAGAARKLSTSRSRVSEQMGKLEQLLDVRLLQRTTRQLTLTSEGEKVYQHATKLSDVLRDVDASINKQVPSGRVTMTLNHDIAHKFLLPKLPLLQQQYPEIQLDLLLEDQAQDLVLEHIDLALRVGVPKDSSMIARPLFEDKFGVFMSPSFIESYSIPSSIEELESLPWLVMPQITNQNRLSLLVNSKPLELKLRKYQICNSPFMVQEMVKAGVGVSILLPSTVKNEVEKGELVRVLPEIGSESLSFSLLYPSRKQLPKRTEAVIDFIIKQKLFD